MRKLLSIIALLVLGTLVAFPARALAMDATITGTGMTGMTCSEAMAGDGGMMDMTTVESLRSCVVHCYDMGYIANAGVEAALVKLLDAAQASVDAGNQTAAIRSLNAFITLLEKQPGNVVDPAHADCLIEHARAVIQALGG